MNEMCRTIRDTLATEGPGALRGDDSAQQHIADCDDCFAFLESLTAIESGLADLPEHDAPDHVVESLLARPELMASHPSGVVRTSGDSLLSVIAGWLRPRNLAWGSAAVAMILAVLVFDQRLDVRKEQAESMIVTKNVAPPAADPAVREVPEPEEELLRSLGYIASESRARGNKDDAQSRKGALTVVVVDANGAPLPGSTVTMSTENPAVPPTAQLTNQDGEAAFPVAEARGEYSVQVDSPGYDSAYRTDLRAAEGQNMQVPIEMQAEVAQRVKVTAERDVIDLEATESSTKFSDEFIAELPVPGRFYQNVLTKAPGVEDADGDGNPNVHGSRSRRFSIEELEVAADKKENKAKRQTDVTSGPTIAGSGPVTRPVLIDTSYVKPIHPEKARAAGVKARVVLQIFVRVDGSVHEVEVLECKPSGMGFEQAAIDAVRQWRYRPATQGGNPVDVFFTIAVNFDPEDSVDSSAAPLPETIRSARNFLEQRRSPAGIPVQSSNGYWANTYVPGDPALRLLRSRLDGWDPRTLPGWLPSTPGLHEVARQVGQPFDVPASSALAVYLHGDRRGMAGEGRMLLQVGLKGTPRHGGRRPAMNLAVVIDLPGEVPTDVAQGVRALIEALNKAKQPGDRFRLFVAGSNDAVVASDEFRHGTLKVTLDRLFDEAARRDEIAGTANTVTSAVECVARDDDPSAPLGSSAVVLITARELGAETDALAALAHEAAVGGISLSVAGVGTAIELQELDRIALSGQGHRRLLTEPADAAALVDRELAAVSRAIARAVRLRIRLAPGVKLVDVVGSDRLDAVRAERVREAEKSIDVRMSRNLGIQADRGEDEQGIQIVIPSFYASDSHVVLLDVVAPGPGPVADVTVRYKDLVHLRNGVARTSLALDHETRAAGPLERNVLKNLLSMRMSGTLEAAGRAVAMSDLDRASRLIEEFRTLLEGLRLEVPGLDNDPEVTRDIAMLAGYRDLLASDLSARPGDRSSLADSLRYAALLKVLPHPLETRS